MKLKNRKFIENRVLILILIICISIIISACHKTDETIKIGVLGTMSDINSDLSVSGRRGVELATYEFNQAGGLNGRKIELVVKDDKNDVNSALSMEKEFISENIPVVIGPYTSGMIVNSMDYLKDKEILFLGPTISVDSISGIDDNFIRFIATTKEQAVALTDMAKKNSNKNFAVIYDLTNKGFNEALYNNFKEMITSNGGSVVLTKTFTSNQHENYSSLAKDILESKVDAVFIIANSADNASISQQIRKIGSKVQIYSPLWSNTTDLIKKGGNAVEGMFIVGAIDMNDKMKSFVKFKEGYLNKYGENPSFSSVYSYEAANALFEAMKKGPDLKPSTLKDNIIKARDFKGLQGDYQIDKFGDNARKYMIFRVENGTLRKVD
jgi:branched-chain amino acid transport system substrate-binding protein